MKMRQGELDLRVKSWGGKRDHAGRKPRRMLVGERKEAAHVERPEVVARFPLHITLRTVAAVRHMRNFEGYLALRRATQVVKGKAGFRLLHASLQENHVHLVVEADDKRALAKGLRAFEVSFARNLNRRIKMRDGKGRRGRVFADRYHARPLRSPTEVRNVIQYVLNNWLHHGGDHHFIDGVVDPYSSATTFLGWYQLAPGQSWRPSEGFDPLPVAEPITWLASVGWLRAGGPISVRAIPGED